MTVKLSALKDGKIKIKADYDGKVVCIKNGIVVDIRKIISGIPITISNLVFGMTVKIYQGLDCLFTIEFVEQLPVIETNKEDIELYNQLVAIKGDEIEIPHALGAIISKISENSKLKQWLYQKIRLGRMPFKALKLIKNYFKESR